jgi:hypothetical protein
MLALLFDECMREIVVYLPPSAAIHERSDAILASFKKAAWHKGF